MKETVFAYAEIKHLFKTKYELDIVITQTGEFLQDDSVWKHPKIIKDIKDFLGK